MTTMIWTTTVVYIDNNNNNNAKGKRRQHVAKLKLLLSFGFLLATVSTFSKPICVPTSTCRTWSVSLSQFSGTSVVAAAAATTFPSFPEVNGDDIPIEFANQYLNEQTDLTIQPFQVAQGGGGFNNRLYQVNNSTTHQTCYLLKIFSDLAKERIALSYPIDERLGELGLGPPILNCYYPMAILMDFIPAPTLTEDDLFQSPPDKRLLQDIAEAMHSLHNLPAPEDDVIGDDSETSTPSPTIVTIPRDKNMLWTSIQLLLNRIKDPPKKEYFTEQVKKHHSILEEEFHLPMVTWGHGDCKPSNIIMDQGGDVRFLDLELTGYNYRAYDLAKLMFRQSLPSLSTTISEKCQDYVLQAYLSSSTSKKADSDDIVVGDIHKSTEQLRLECNLLLPMTWLEAALFFEATKDTVVEVDDEFDENNPNKSNKTKKKEEWDRLAQDRLVNYQKACESPLFLEYVDAYREIILLEQ